MAERHLLEQAEHCAKPLVDGRRGAVVQNLLRQDIASERRCPDRGMGVGSKDALIQVRHKCSEQLALAN
jgi:hypothetical protein